MSRRFYCWIAVAIFVVEVLIALFVRDRFVRPYLGDFLVVGLVYCALRVIWKAPVLRVALVTLLFSYCIEVLQYFQFVNRIGLGGNVVARTVIGYGFDWADLLMYTLGVLTILILERKTIRKEQTMGGHKQTANG